MRHAHKLLQLESRGAALIHARNVFGPEGFVKQRNELADNLEAFEVGTISPNGYFTALGMGADWEKAFYNATHKLNDLNHVE